MIRKCHYKRKKTSLSGGKLRTDKSLSGSYYKANSWTAMFSYTSYTGYDDFTASYAGPEINEND